MSIVFAGFAYLLPIHVQIGRGDEAALTLSHFSGPGKHYGVLGGVAGSADTNWYINRLKNLFHGLDCVLGRGVLQ